MPKVKHTMPKPSRQKGQRSLDLPEWLYRIIPPWNNPQGLLNAKSWRMIVARQPIAVDCREFLISSFLSLDWKIEPKESDKRDELKEEIDYYTKFITYTGDYHYDEIVEWAGKDLLDIPFGVGAEVGRVGDRPEGRVVWLEMLDGGTLFPTYSKKWPVGQIVPEIPMEPVVFPKHAIDRVYYSPHTELKLKGWGMPPPEKIYLALELINRGDVYYANLLLDTPEAGILDLGDMSKTSAEAWVKAFRSLLGGIDPMKIPVLYEHNSPVEFIPFGKPPTELMFDKITAKYASIVAAGYGISLSDIGIQVAASGGETLAGSIRQERKTRRTGFSKFKTKMVAFFNFLLPDTLEFKVIDNDEEQAVAAGRALLTNATGLGQLIELGVISPQEARLQLISSGMMTISMPETIPPDAKPMLPAGGVDERPAQTGKPEAPSQGGHGEVLPRADIISEKVHRVFDFGNDDFVETLIQDVINPLAVEVRSVLEMENGEVAAWQDWHDEILWGNMLEEIPELTQTTLSVSRVGLNWFNPELFLNGDEIYQEYFSDLSEYESPIKARIFDIIQEIDRNLKRDIQNAIIAGTRKALIHTDMIAKSLDENEIIVDNDAVRYVRLELERLEKATIANISGRLAEDIKELLEEN